MKILIAEDEPVSRKVLSNAILKLGHECRVAVDGRKAWELFERSGADVVISDWMMPGLDGIEFCRRVRQHGGQGYTHFILLTALADRRHLLDGLQSGADD